MRHVEDDVVLLRPAAPPFLDLLVHAARDEVARRQVLEGRRVALHEALAGAVAQDRALAAAALGEQHPGAVDAGRVELPELHVLERDRGARRHAEAVAGVDEGVGRGGEDPPGAAGGEHHRLGLQDVQLAGLHLERGDADHRALGVADQVERHPLDEEVGPGLDVLLVERVQHRVAGAVGRGAGALHRLFAVVGGVAAERALVDRAVRIAVERHAEVLELVDDVRRLAAHELDRVLVAEPVGALDRVVEVIVPVVLAHVAERGADAALRRDRVRAGREHLGQHGDVQAGARQAQRRLHAGAAGADDDDVEAARRHRGGSDCRAGSHHSLQSTCTAQPAQPTSQAIVSTCRPRRTPIGLHVVHPDVAHADPDVPEHRDDDDEGEHLHPLPAEDRRPLVVVDRPADQELRQDGDREDRHDQRGEALRQPVAQAVVRADDEPLGTVGLAMALRTGRTAWRRAPGSARC